MSVTARLVYDPAADSSSHKVGSYVLAGDDGTQIGHVSDALKVNFSNTTIDVTASALDIRALTQTDEVTVFQGTDPWVVSATNLDIRDLTHASDSIRLGDGTDLITSTLSGGKQALDVYIANAGSIDIDDSLANTAIFTESRAVSTSAITLTAAAALSARKWLYMANEGNKSVFIGPSGVTAADGFPVHPGQQSEFRIGASVAPYVIGEAGASSEDIRVMQLS